MSCQRLCSGRQTWSCSAPFLPPAQPEERQIQVEQRAERSQILELSVRSAGSEPRGDGSLEEFVPDLEGCRIPGRSSRSKEKWVIVLQAQQGGDGASQCPKWKQSCLSWREWKVQRGKSPNTRPWGERLQNKGQRRGRSTGSGQKGLFYPLTKPRSEGRILEKAARSVTLSLRLQFLWGSGRGSNDKMINIFPFSPPGSGHLLKHNFPFSFPGSGHLLINNLPFFPPGSGHLLYHCSPLQSLSLVSALPRVQQHSRRGNLRRWSRDGWKGELNEGWDLQRCSRRCWRWVERETGARQRLSTGSVQERELDPGWSSGNVSSIT